MKLLNLPTIAKDRIFKYMAVHEIFLLSTCSILTKEAIKSSSLQTKYDGVKMTSTTYIKGSISVCSSGKEGEFWKVVDWQNHNQRSNKTMKIRGLLIKFRIKFHIKTGVPCLMIDEYQRSTPVELFNYITDLFKTTKVIELRLRKTDFSDIPSSITSVKNVQMDTYCQFAQPRIFRSFLERVHVENCFISEQSVRGVPDRNTPLKHVQNLYLEQAVWVHQSLLLGFTGRHIYLENTKLRTYDMKDFVEQWVEGQICVNLETVIISTELVYRYGEVLQEVPSFYGQGRAHEGRYVYNAAFRDFFQKEFDFLNCADCHEITRITDGVIASVKILSETKSGVTRHYFFMFVWHDDNPAPGEFQNNEPGYRFL